jgi:LacI family transcriptional regulator
MKSRPSLTAIGKEMNVSVAAVSNALSGKGRMSQELRDKIINYANKLGYRPNVNANRLRDGKSNQILFGALVEENSLFDVNHAFLIHYLINNLMKHGYDLVVHPLYRTAASRQHFLDKILSRAVDGVILQMDASLEPDLVSKLAALKTPAVIFDSSSDAAATTDVSIITTSFVKAFSEACTALNFSAATPIYYFDNAWSKYDATYRDFLIACTERPHQLYDASSYPAVLKSVETIAANSIRPFGLVIRQSNSLNWCLRAIDHIKLKPGRDVQMMLCSSGKYQSFYDDVPIALIMDSYEDIAKKLTELLLCQLSGVNNSPISYIYPAKLQIF